MSNEYFWKHVEKMPSGCWFWRGPNRIRNWMSAHRLVYFLVTGHYPMPDEAIIHSCDNYRCCNPDHRFLVNVNEPL